MEWQQEYILQAVEDKDVHFMRLWFTDVVERLRSVATAPAELEEVLEEGIGFNGLSIQDIACVCEDDMTVRPDAETFSILPWHDGDVPVARMFCDVLTCDNEPMRSDSRSILRRILDKAVDMGLSCFAHPEVEFYLFHPENGPNKEPIPIDNSSYFDHATRSFAQNSRHDAILTLEDMGVSVKFSHHEAGPGQNEIDLQSTDALRMADSVVTLKTVVERTATERGAHASFMLKPLINSPGNRMHTHFSLFERGRPVFHDATGPRGLSRTGQRFVADLLCHTCEITVMTNQYVDPYERLYSGDEAPSYAYWGSCSRSALVRIPTHNPDKPQSTRVEYRAFDSAAGPYLAFAIVLRAGPRGIEGDYELPIPTETDVAFMSDFERGISGIERLPSSLREVVDLMKVSELVAETLGEDCFDYLLHNKRHE